jgi:hypothetical protein
MTALAGSETERPREGIYRLPLIDRATGGPRVFRRNVPFGQ